MKRTALIFALQFLFVITGFSQNSNGEIHGRVFDSEGVPLEGVVVKVDNGMTLNGAASDSVGRFRVKPLVPGTYTVEMRMVGMQSKVYEGVEVNPDKITTLPKTMLEFLNDSSRTVIIETYTIPLIDRNGGNVVTIRSKELNQMSSSNGGDLKKMIVSLSSDVKASADSEELYFRGSRSGSVIYLIDGVKIRENVPNVPSSGISSMSIYTGGLPAKYGDTTGGVIVIETKSYLEDYYEKLSRMKKTIVLED
ncbi:MAG: carboxypeptidase regulatory-like domain-containing protein [Flavobacteriales bacterium]